MRLLSRSDDLNHTTDESKTDDDSLPYDGEDSQLRHAEADALAAEELAAVARARAERLRAQTTLTEDPCDSGVLTGTVVGDNATAAASSRGPRRPVLAAIVTTIALITSAVLLAASGYMLHHHHQFVHEQQRKAEFAAAASQAIVTLMTVDSAKADENVHQIIAESTGQFRDDFQSDADDFAKVARESKSATKATVRAAAVESMATDSAVVLVTATTSVSDAGGANQRPRNWRLAVTMVRDGAQPKMSKVEFVP